MARKVSRRSQRNRKMSLKRKRSRSRSSLRKLYGRKRPRTVGGHSFKAGDTVEVKDAPDHDLWRSGVVEKAADSMVRVRYTDGEKPDVEFIVNFDYMRLV